LPRRPASTPKGLGFADSGGVIDGVVIAACAEEVVLGAGVGPA